MAIPDHARTNFNTLLRAAGDGNLALMECLDAVTGERRYVLCAVGRAEDEAVDESQPRLIAVKFHSDTDAASKAIDARYLTKVRADMGEKDILFLTADLTSKATRHQAALLLNALALQSLWKQFSGTPGKFVVLNIETEEVAATFGADADAEKVRAALDGLLSGEGGCAPCTAEGGCDEGDGCDG